MWKSDYLVILFDAPDYTILKLKSGSASARSLKRHNIPTMKCSLLLVMCLLTFHPVFSQKQHLIDSFLIDVQRLKDERKATGAMDTTFRDTFTCTPRGHIHIKGKGEVEMYFVEGGV